LKIFGDIFEGMDDLTDWRRGWFWRLLVLERGLNRDGTLKSDGGQLRAEAGAKGVLHGSGRRGDPFMPRIPLDGR